MRVRGSIAARKSFASVIGMIAVVSGAHAADLPAPPLNGDAYIWPPAPISDRWTTTFASAVRYYSWSGTRGTPGNASENRGSGTQVYVPYALQVIGQPTDEFKVELLGRGGWVSSRQNTLGLSGEAQTATDTLATGTVTYLGLGGMQPFFSLNLNMPTGKSALFGSAANARMDPDLVELGGFGEGWNIGPTIGANIELTDTLIATFAAGYTWRGVYDRENSLAVTTDQRDNQQLTHVDSGDVFTLTAAVSYRNGPWTAKVNGAISTETTTFENGVALFKAGTSYRAGTIIDHAWQNGWGVSSFTGIYSRSGNNNVKFRGNDELVVEPFNTNSNLYSAWLQHLWQRDNFWFGPVGSILYRDRNGYNSGTLQFVPAKLRYTAGVTAYLVQGNGLSLDLRAEHVWMREGETTAINGQMYSVLANGYVLNEATPERSSRGWRFSGGLNVKF